ncbi:hypothetical protein F5Y14DRAFT_404847 [Nemania sp. NC0429]|nr:hypothetical protein F5Y14DRAFT_404847 [Nemania sp. NC0429]
MSSTPSEAKPDDIVDWAGPDDPANPRNWRKGIKLIHVALISIFTLYTQVEPVGQDWRHGWLHDI